MKNKQLGTSLEFLASELFHHVQTSGLFKDSKTFADAQPKCSYAEIYAAYDAISVKNKENLKVFVEQHFTLPESIELLHELPDTNVKAHIAALWPILTKPADPQSLCSLLPLSQAYVVPGGRFREIYYWDSYFTAQGLAEANQWHLIESMVSNFCELIDLLGSIPNGNRSYYHSRSQPPVLAMMVNMLVQRASSVEQKREYLQGVLPSLEKEYAFWMAGEDQLSEQATSHRRLVRMPCGAKLNRYWDDDPTPRPESYQEDLHLASALTTAEQTNFYRNIRAACESGWDFSSRWLTQPNQLTSIQTTNIIPVDLNCLLYKFEQLLAEFYALMGNEEKQQSFVERATLRAQCINRYLWDDKAGFYFDYLIKQQSRSQIYTAAAVVPLYVEIADSEKAKLVSAVVSNHFVEEGGLKTTLHTTEQQWDGVNGWAPLHWFAVNGLLHYGFKAQAINIAKKWLNTVERHFASHQSLKEKYNVVDPNDLAKGGEYEVQHGFGWTNGVTLGFYRLLAENDNVIEKSNHK